MLGTITFALERSGVALGFADCAEGELAKEKNRILTGYFETRI